MFTTPDLQIVTRPAKPFDNGMVMCMDAFLQIDTSRVTSGFYKQLHEYLNNGAVKLHTARLKPAPKQ
jgi:hypothetical protein